MSVCNASARRGGPGPRAPAPRGRFTAAGGGRIDGEEANAVATWIARSPKRSERGENAAPIGDHAVDVRGMFARLQLGQPLALSGGGLEHRKAIGSRARSRKIAVTGVERSRCRSGSDAKGIGRIPISVWTGHRGSYHGRRRAALKFDFLSRSPPRNSRVRQKAYSPETRTVSSLPVQ